MMIILNIFKIKKWRLKMKKRKQILKDTKKEQSMKAKSLNNQSKYIRRRMSGRKK